MFISANSIFLFLLVILVMVTTACTINSSNINLLTTVGICREDFYHFVFPPTLLLNAQIKSCNDQSNWLTLLTNRLSEKIIGEFLPVSWWARDMIIFHVNVFDIQTINKERNCNQKETIEHRIAGPVCHKVKQTHFNLEAFRSAICFWCSQCYGGGTSVFLMRTLGPLINI